MSRPAISRTGVLLLLGLSGTPAIAGLLAAFWIGLDKEALSRVLDTPGIGLSIGSSLWTGATATLLALLLAHLALALAATGGWRQKMYAWVLPLIAMPHLAIGIGIALLLAPSGVLLRLVSPWPSGFDLPPDWLIVNDPAGLSLIGGLVVKEACFLILALAAALSQVPAERLQAQASTLGYGRLKGWLVSVAPLLQTQIRLPLAAVLVFGISNVEMAIPLGPDLPPTFSVLLWRWFTDPEPAIHAQAYAGTLVLLAICITAVAVAHGLGLLGRKVVAASAHSGERRADERPFRRPLGAVLCAGWALGALAIVAILLRAVAGAWRFPELLPADWSISRLQELASLSAGTGAATVTLAIATALVGIALILPAAEHCKTTASARRQVGAWLFIPLLVPQMTFLFGVQVLLVRIGIDGTFIAVLWSHLLFALPYLWGILAPARAAIDPRYDEIAVTLGVARFQTWLTVTLPLLCRALLLAFALAVSVSVALYLPTLFAGAGRIATAATEAAAAAGSGNMRLAAAHAILLAVIPFAAFAVAFASGALVFRRRRGVPR